MAESSELHNLKIEKLRAEIEQTKINTAKSSAELDALERRQREWRASADENRVYMFWSEVNKASVRECMADLAQWSRRVPDGEMQIWFNSPGGSSTDGLALYDFLLELRAMGHHITTVAFGMAASMGGILLQAGDVRAMGANAHLLIHEVSQIAIGKMSEVEDDIAFGKKIQDRLLDILAARSSMNKAQIRTKWKKTDWWLNAQESLELGFIDQIRVP